jgi:uncharacterized membrane protein
MAHLSNPLLTMTLSLKSLTLFGAVLMTGLSAGLFCAWTVSVIPGTRRVPDRVYLETMQAINRAILNPVFFLIFFGSLILLVVSTLQQFQAGLTFWLLLAAALIYLVGTVGVTGMGNVPLNNGLDALDVSKLSVDKLARTRHQYEVSWNRLHTIRTVFALLAFMLSLLGIITQQRTL